MVQDRFVLAFVASLTLCADCARREDLIDGGSHGEDIPEDQASFKSLVHDFSPVGSLLQQGVSVHATSPTNSTTTDSHIKLEVSQACLNTVRAASKYCHKESVWFYQCAPPIMEEDPELSFPLEEACLAEVRNHSMLKDVKTGCCSDHPKYKGGCCRPTNLGMAFIVSLSILPCCCCCCCGGLLVMFLRSRQVS
eukprot:TRINITY_DN2677_c0_g4_i1.p1 TRINITY_DN2677_c0_g4~~TRINITY_DN2677_c0_g4_i1.p1  ORF type:complete len:194 (+),score=12.49 TRINITY_DN2677_c0_g4_i1:77-658(+)